MAVVEVAEFNRPGFIALDAIVFYFQSALSFPSWTSRVRTPSPAPFFIDLQDPTDSSLLRLLH